jgi:sugar/nucleoside kinase (ribokinase family)
MTAKEVDVAAAGHAIVDVLTSADDRFLTQHGIAKGSMTLIDSHRAELLSKLMRNPIEASGGSAGNTAAGIAGFGGKAAFIGKVHEDRLGEVYIEDMNKIGVRFACSPAKTGAATGRCHIVVTPDGQRSMSTYLGCSGSLDRKDMDEALISKAKIFFVEGYLWDDPGTKDAIRHGMALAKKSGCRIAFTLSDTFCVGRWRSEFLELIDREIDILFANEGEAKALYETTDFDDAFQALARMGKTIAITRSEKGSVLAHAREVHLIDADPVDRVVDTTGAGDFYAAGVLFGLTENMPLAKCGKLGSLAAAACITHMGPRPPVSLKALAAQRGLV